MTRFPTLQSMFDHIAKHLITQNRKAKLPDSPACYYHLPGDPSIQCGVGCIIPDSIYSKNMEARPVDTVLSKFPELLDVLPTDREVEEVTQLLRVIQYVHDNYPTYSWLEELNRLAKNYGLKEYHHVAV